MGTGATSRRSPVTRLMRRIWSSWQKLQVVRFPRGRALQYDQHYLVEVYKEKGLAAWILFPPIDPGLPGRRLGVLSLTLIAMSVYVAFPWGRVYPAPSGLGPKWGFSWKYKDPYVYLYHGKDQGRGKARHMTLVDLRKVQTYAKRIRRTKQR